MLSIHAGLAGALKAPELILDGSEAKNLAEAIANVAQHYPTNIDPKVLAWVNLAGVAGMVYGPRVFMIAARQEEKKAASKAAPTATNEAPAPATLGPSSGFTAADFMGG